MPSNKYDVAIIGSGLAGSLTALYLQQQQPHLSIALLGEPASKRPIVGESLTEFSTMFLHELGLTDHLEQEHFHKYGLSFYFKETTGGGQYAMHEAPAIPPIPSNMLNRTVFDEKLNERISESEVERFPVRVKDVDLIDDDSHRVHLKTGEEIDAKWLIDCSGRNRFLVRKLGLGTKPRHQRSCFWFRMNNFDRSLLDSIPQVKQKQHCFDSYYVTHHFMGKGNWIWLIPMRDSDGKQTMSVGIVYRPDLVPAHIRSMEQFSEQIENEHPELAEFLQSGSVVDTNSYSNYMYGTSQLYSSNRWAVIGDAGLTVDPLYSTGIVMNAIQIKQVEVMIAADQKNELSKESIDQFQSIFFAMHEGLQNEISNLYEVMDDPYQCQWRVHFASSFYFYFLLPCWLNGYMLTPNGIRFMLKVIEDGQRKVMSLNQLLSQASKEKGHTSALDLPNRYSSSVNWNLWGPDESKLKGYLQQLTQSFICYRLEILKDAGWKHLMQHSQFLSLDALNYVGLKILQLTRIPVVRNACHVPSAECNVNQQKNLAGSTINHNDHRKSKRKKQPNIFSPSPLRQTNSN